MTDNKRKTDRHVKERAASGEQSRVKNEAGYDVGYGKPPKRAQFTKGQSGNPRGRPRKKDKRPIRLSDAVSEKFLEEEAYRRVTLRENGQAIELPVTQAVMRSMATSAIKGNRLSQKYFLEWLAHVENVHYRAKLDRYIRLQELKREGEAQIEQHRRKDLPPPELLPHPDDIVLNPVTGHAYISGPETKEDLEFYEQAVQMRNHLALCSVHAEKNGKTSLLSHEGKSACSYLILAQLLDSFLPSRFQWTELEFVNLMMNFRSMTKRARERLIASEFARLRRERKPLHGITPEAAEILERVRKQWLDKAS